MEMFCTRDWLRYSKINRRMPNCTTGDKQQFTFLNPKFDLTNNDTFQPFIRLKMLSKSWAYIPAAMAFKPSNALKQNQLSILMKKVM